jgi:GTPase SAR1 family protein
VKGRDWSPRAHADQETDIAALYRILGYKVTRISSVGPGDAKIECDKYIPGMGRVSLYIHHKERRFGVRNPVTTKDVRAFASTFHNHREHRGWTAGVIVSNGSFSSGPLEAAQEYPNVSLKTVSDLFEDAFAVRSYLQESVRTYEAEKAVVEYIPPKGRLLNPDLTPKEEAQDLSMLTKSWISNSDSVQLCLLGDFGMGKTTFLRHLQYSLSQRYLAGSFHRIPLLISLRKYFDARDGEDLLMRFFQVELGSSVTASVLDFFLRRGSLLLLFDGFDEMGVMSSIEMRRQAYQKLSYGLVKKNKVIITSRPGYFLPESEFVKELLPVATVVGPPPFRSKSKAPVKRWFQDESPGGSLAQSTTADDNHVVNDSRHDVVFCHLELFDAAQIRGYIKKASNRIIRASQGHVDARSLLDRIRDTYDLEDLARRPVLLRLMTDTLPLFYPDSHGGYVVEVGQETTHVNEINPSLLYQVYIENEFQRDAAKSAARNILDIKVKRQMISALAFRMVTTDRIALDPEEVRATIEPWASSKPDMVERMAADLRSTSILVRDSDDHIKFAHKSFLEYFAALHIVQHLGDRTRAYQVLSSFELSAEILKFLKELVAVSYPALMTTLEALAQSLIGRSSSKDIICHHNISALLGQVAVQKLRPNKALAEEDSPSDGTASAERPSKEQIQFARLVASMVKEIIGLDVNHKDVPDNLSREGKGTSRTAVVLMPFREPFNKYYTVIWKPAIEEVGFSSVRADEMFGANPVMSDLWGSICRARVVVAELTGRNPNVMYEIGLSHAIGKPVVLLAQTIEDVPFDLRSLRCLLYDTRDPEWASRLRSDIKASILSACEGAFYKLPPA